MYHVQLCSKNHCNPSEHEKSDKTHLELHDN